jgi:hypothetical protein
MFQFDNFILFYIILYFISYLSLLALKMGSVELINDDDDGEIVEVGYDEDGPGEDGYDEARPEASPPARARPEASARDDSPPARARPEASARDDSPPARARPEASARDDSPPARARPEASPPARARPEASARDDSLTKKDFIIRFDDIVSNQLHANSFYVFKSLTQEERAMVHRLANGYELFHWDESQVVRHHKIFVTIISNRPADKNKVNEIPRTKHRQAIAGSLATTTQVHIPDDPEIALIVATKTKKVPVPVVPIACEVCGKSCKTALGLGSHMRTHRN